MTDRYTKLKSTLIRTVIALVDRWYQLYPDVKPYVYMKVFPDRTHNVDPDVIRPLIPLVRKRKPIKIVRITRSRTSKKYISQNGNQVGPTRYSLGPIKQDAMIIQDQYEESPKIILKEEKALVSDEFVIDDKLEQFNIDYELCPNSKVEKIFSIKKTCDHLISQVEILTHAKPAIHLVNENEALIIHENNQTEGAKILFNDARLLPVKEICDLNPEKILKIKNVQMFDEGANHHMRALRSVISSQLCSRCSDRVVACDDIYYKMLYQSNGNFDLSDYAMEIGALSGKSGSELVRLAENIMRKVTIHTTTRSTMTEGKMISSDASTMTSPEFFHMSAPITIVKGTDGQGYERQGSKKEERTGKEEERMKEKEKDPFKTDDRLSISRFNTKTPTLNHMSTPINLDVGSQNLPPIFNGGLKSSDDVKYPAVDLRHYEMIHEVTNSLMRKKESHMTQLPYDPYDEPYEWSDNDFD